MVCWLVGEAMCMSRGTIRSQPACCAPARTKSACVWSLNGPARVTPGKRMTLTIGDDIFDLSGIWQYAVTAEADRDCPFEDFVRWKPTGLYNAMLAPCFPYAVRAVLWYQGESNTGDRAMRYGDELKAMIQLWRVKWHQPDMPFLIVQLPKFDIDAIEDGAGHSSANRNGTSRTNLKTLRRW